MNWYFPLTVFKFFLFCIFDSFSIIHCRWILFFLYLHGVCECLLCFGCSLILYYNYIKQIIYIYMYIYVSQFLLFCGILDFISWTYSRVLWHYGKPQLFSLLIFECNISWNLSLYLWMSFFFLLELTGDFLLCFLIYWVFNFQHYMWQSFLQISISWIIFSFILLAFKISYN